MPLVFLLFVAIATGALSAYAGRDELRHNGEAVWRTESFLAYGLFVLFLLIPTLVYFYVFHGDWFLFYWVDTRRAPWVWGMLAALFLVGAALLETGVADVIGGYRAWKAAGLPTEPARG